MEVAAARLPDRAEMGARSSTLHANVASENAISGIVAGGERDRLQSNRTEGNPRTASTWRRASPPRDESD